MSDTPKKPERHDIWRVRSLPNDELETELNACEMGGYTVMNMLHHEEHGFSSVPHTTVFAKRLDAEDEEGTLAHTCELLTELAEDAARLACFATDKYVDGECGDCLPCRARMVLESLAAAADDEDVLEIEAVGEIDKE